MANVIISPNMNLPVPVVGVDPGPDWANNIDSCLSVVDGHNHTSGNGVPIPPTGLNINSDLPFQTNNATQLRSVRFTPQSAALSATTDLGCLYEVNQDLYYNDGAGNQIRITQSGSVSGASGTITGLPSGTASAAFASASGTFVYQQSTGVGANCDIGTLILRYPGSYPTPSGTYISIQVPSSIASSYSITLPAATPSATAALTMDTSGNIAASTALYLAFCPTGVVLPYAGSSAPLGWLSCDGSAVSRTTYANLFALIGTTFGSGDGSTTFNLPNMSGNVAIGPGGAIGASLGGTGGEATHTLSIGEMPSHAHQYASQAGPGGTNDSIGYVATSIAENEYGALNTTSTGGGSAHNNVQPYLCLHYIIKT